MANIVSNGGLGVGPWFRNKIVDPFLHILRRGTEPRQLAFSAGLGITLGIFPICGVTVLLCALAIAVLGSYCHAPTVLLANFVATPIELSLVIPFLRLGEFLSGGEHFPLTADALKKVFTGQASKEVLLSVFHAVLGWLAAGPFILALLYIIFLPCFKILVRKFNPVPTSPRLSTPLTAEVSLKVNDTRDRRTCDFTYCRRSRSHNFMDNSGSQASVASKPTTTTYVQTDSTSFRDIVQRLTGGSRPKGKEKEKESAAATKIGQSSLSKGQTKLKLHERRQYSKPILHIPKPTTDCSQIEQDVTTVLTLRSPSPAAPYSSPKQPWNTSFMMCSPNKRGSSASSFYKTGSDVHNLSSVKERRLYMNSSPRSMTRDDEPELLTLFPLTSPKNM